MAQLEQAPSTDRRPRPEPDDTTRFHWDAAGEHRLVLQRCRSCTKLQYPPDVACVHCGSESFEHVEVTGRGRIYSYAIVDRPLHAGFAEALPYVVVLVELDDQPELRMIANLVDLAPATPLTCGMRVAVAFEDRGSVTLPQFRVVDAGA